LIESDSILLTPEQSLNRGGNNLDLRLKVFQTC
jgi:hypothetical protein